SCLGRCDTAPAVLLNNGPVSPPPGGAISESTPPSGTSATHQWGCDPCRAPSGRSWLFPELLEGGGGAAAQRWVTTFKDSRLRGMGGAGLPTGVKWDLVRQEKRTPKYIICNADESEPGTFKDRVVLAELPHLVIEGMLLAALVVQAEKGILFIRHEYAPERALFARALEDARQRGLLGRDVLGSGFSFDLEIFVSPGGYILGGETPLL